MHLFAYLDPGTGSIIIQAVIGTIVGVGVAVKAYWFKIVSFFGKSPKDNSKNSAKKDLRK